MHFLSKVYKSVKEGQCTAALFVDIMKTFDMVDHNTLLERMRKIGIRGVVLKWFQSFMIGQYQRVRVKW